MIDHLSLNFFQPGAGGIPTSTLLASLTGVADSYDHSIADQYGFETATIGFDAPLDVAVWWFDQLGAGAVFAGPDAETIWEGLLNGVAITIGNLTQSRSLESMGNRVRVRYTTVNDVPAVTATASNTASQTRYGVKDRVEGLNKTTSTAATALRDRTLNAYKQPSSETQAATGQRSPLLARVTLSCVGWYDTLGWIVTSRTDTTAESTTTQVGDLIAASGVGIGVTNAFLSTSTRRIASSGTTDTRQIAEDTPYRTKLEAVLSQGDSTGQALAWGVYDDRVFVVEQWAGANPTTYRYEYRADEQAVYDAQSSGFVWPWDVRPNAMVVIPRLLDVGPPSGAPDAGGRFYGSRVTCHVDRTSMAVTIEPAANKDLAATLARLLR